MLFDETFLTKRKKEEMKYAPFEKMLLGALLFIPGSYHTVVAFLAWSQSAGFTYDDVSAFEDDSFHDKDD